MSEITAPRSSRRRAVLTTAVLAAVALLASCAGPDAGSDASPSDTDPSASASESTASAVEQVTGDLVVFAAASLQGVFEELGTTFEEQHPGVSVTFSFAASSALAEQVNSGAPVDVLATASASTMEQAAAEVTDPVTFASNTLVIVSPTNSQGGVTGLADFANPDLTLAVCAVEVPCGAAASTVFEAAGVTPSVDTYAENVTAALNLAASGEVDASLVYATDARSAGDTVTTITFPEAAEAVNDNLIAVATAAPNPHAARAWVDLVLSAEGTAVLEAAGFDLP
ncbi:molybdate ABC transporter substrate-binding protein [Serinibacter arcticus]|uniref:Molybdate ABC transporter substrate-binding protein n=1 Tax=Serinibacter arcticus TaxID=1655435 RepID=A0A2U1ZWP5_9MICO|nr:molybdate ABC transporter substrate-binding protein [Serinibacter arcticus]PWD51405.1 molybdate ABC transporter substrate-binding protein [Serinibacter arcticus]